ncbi:DUF4340 domain-containing protein [Microseira wollei]|uniref:DUF4340 domain-containing protein n=1 Tax=Microseira wollei NIES-4236 TaxID=2530354 RepID=A0AAV3XET1_9CYAN|nr:DUF4340 domain-containing protein [Microseira wollei]GET41078.1 hypothetical protein MiSe_58900 [Microseira wollei NIES-4236]
MKLQQSTWILILAAILLGGIVYVYEIEGRPQREATKALENKLFDFQENDVQSVTLKTKDKTLLFERNSQPPSGNSTQPKWLMTVLEMAKSTPTPTPTQTPVAIATPPNPTQTPVALATPPTPTPQATPIAPPPETNLTKVPANEAYVVFLLDQMVKGKGDRITIDPRIDYGLNQPQATIDVKLNNGKTHQLILGKPNFNNTSVYAIADPTAQGNQSPQILVISNNFENAVNRPLSEWKQPEQQQNPEKK